MPELGSRDLRQRLVDSPLVLDPLQVIQVAQIFIKEINFQVPHFLHFILLLHQTP